MAVYRKGDKWRVRVWLRGERQDRIVSGSKADALAVEAALRTEMARSSTSPTPTVPLFSVFLAKYQVHAEAHLRASTHSNRKYTWATLLKHFGHVGLDEIGTAAVEEFKAARLADKVKPATVNANMNALRAILGYAREFHVLPEIRWRALPEVGRRRVVAWTRAEVDALYRSVQKEAPDILPIVVFLANTGCRKSEAIALESANVNLKRGVVTIQPSVAAVYTTKDNEAREVPINSALRPWLKGVKGQWVFPSSTGERFAFWPQRKFDLARRKAGLVGGPHTLRHTYATHFLASTPDLFLLARVLGHSTTYVTELYSHLLPEAMRRAAKAVSFPARPRAV